MTDPISNVVDASCNEAIAQVTEALKQKPIKSLRAGEMAIAASQIVQRVSDRLSVAQPSATPYKYAI